MGRWKTKHRATHCPNGHEYSPENTAIGSKEERVCLTCQRERMRRKRADPAFLEYQKLAMRKYRDANRDLVNALTRERNARIADELKALKAQLKCRECGEDHPACLEFHHRDPGQKEGNVSIMFRKVRRERWEAEIAKCDVLCSNCHRKLHHDERVKTVAS